MNKVEVVIVGSSANALGALRSLAPFYQCLLVSDNKHAPAWHSKHGQKKWVESTKDHRLIEALNIIVGESVAPAVLLLTEEKSVEYISAHRKKLSKAYLYLLPEHQLVLALQSKIGFQELAEQHNAPIPKGIEISTTENLLQLSNLNFPCVFKPLRQSNEYSQRFKKAYKVEKISDIVELYEEIAPVMPDMIAQEWITGKDSDIYFCLAIFDENSDLISSFTGRKIRSWPLNIGGTAACMNAPEHHLALEKITSDFAKAAGVKGMMGMEYKYDTQRKGFYMIEPTIGRTDYQHEIATLSGVNILQQMCQQALKQVVSSYKDIGKPIMWFDEIADANALAHGGEVIEPVNITSYGAVKRSNDIKPFINQLKTRIVLKLKRFFSH